MKDYANIVAEAVKAVTSVDDPKLKEIAFTQVLSRLLGPCFSDEDESTEAKPIRRRSGAKPKAHERAGGSTPGPAAWLQELIEEKFFSEPKPVAAILEELSNRSHHLEHSDLTRPLQALCHDKRLRRKKLPFGETQRQVLHWCNW